MGIIPILIKPDFWEEIEKRIKTTGKVTGTKYHKYLWYQHRVLQ